MTITLEDSTGRVLAEITPGEGMRVKISHGTHPYPPLEPVNPLCPGCQRALAGVGLGHWDKEIQEFHPEHSGDCGCH